MPSGREVGSLDSVEGLIRQLQIGDRALRDKAAKRLWDCFSPQLLAIARRHLDGRVRSRVDAEDVLQSMGKSFFKRLARDDFAVTGRDDLWALLVTITLNKARNAASRHLRARRDVRREFGSTSPTEATSADGNSMFLDPTVTTEPTPEQAALLSEAFEKRLLELEEPGLRELALLKMAGHSNRESAMVLGCSERSVERRLNLIRKRWNSLE